GRAAGGRDQAGGGGGGPGEGGRLRVSARRLRGPPARVLLRRLRVHPDQRRPDRAVAGGTMARFVELRRHTDNDGDVLTPDGVAAALQLRTGLAGGYRVAVSTGAQRATQTVGCLLAALGQPVPDGVVGEAGVRSGRGDRRRGP